MLRLLTGSDENRGFRLRLLQKRRRVRRLLIDRVGVGAAPRVMIYADGDGPRNAAD